MVHLRYIYKQPQQIHCKHALSKAVNTIRKSNVTHPITSSSCVKTTLAPCEAIGNLMPTFFRKSGLNRTVRCAGLMLTLLASGFGVMAQSSQGVPAASPQSVHLSMCGELGGGATEMMPVASFSGGNLNEIALRTSTDVTLVGKLPPKPLQ
jgi:hypothetical protein